MKNINKQFLFTAVLLTSLLFVSCYEEDLTGQSTIEVAQNVVGTVQFVAPLAATQTVNEKNQGKYQYKVNISNAQPVDIYLDVKVKSGTATRGADFDFDEHLIIKAYTKSVTGNINIINDAVFETTETFVLEIGGDVDISNASIPASTISFSIVNGLADNLDLKFNFQKGFVDGTTAKTLCGIGYDMDFYVLDANYNDIGNYQAAASGCPELLTVSPAKFKNGTYHIFYDLYDNHGLPAMNTPEFTIPISVDYSRGGGVSGTFNQEAEFAFTSKALGYVQSANNEPYDYVVTIVVNNGVYTLKNSKGATVANARTSNKIAAAIQHARLNNKK
ncbi:hypothetical protein FNW25_10345 [Flavobacterium franklandianum]|uniref:Uncharacterized protein n=1 Tax=Flavobacterium franklandianum TaxID=2594430 RepID=A0A553CR42_9FLAO|nr:Calx-beta domain-containing protein [Flavobacterium franklandianum]TRX22915.1 hypothetical protein FNW17_03880 [Flavobacterium franklandianum]TRX24939.1 hypothetical protein FNW25_10345 [Flavobacterium franklandianum]